MNFLITDTEYDEAISNHINWITWALGLTTFLLALSALQYTQPWKIALVGLMVVIPMCVQAVKQFPKDVKALMELADANCDAKKELHSLRIKHQGKHVICKAIFVTSSLTFYMTVLFSGTNFGAWILWLKL